MKEMLLMVWHPVQSDYTIVIFSFPSPWQLDMLSYVRLEILRWRKLKGGSAFWSVISPLLATGGRVCAP